MSETTEQVHDRNTLIAEGLIEAIWDWDLRTDEVYFSPQWKSMLGYAEKEIPGRFDEWARRIHADDRDRVLQAIRDHINTQAPLPRLEHRLRHKDDTYRWFVTRALCLRDKGGQPYRMVGSHTDITDRKRLQEELNRFFTVSLDLCCIVDFQGWFRRLNPAWERVTGWTIEELLARPYLEFVHPGDRRATLQVSRRLATGMDVVSFENRYLCKDGSQRWFLWNAVPARDERLIYAAARDITEFKQVQEALLRAREEATRLKFEARYTELVEHASYGIFRATLDGHFVYVNPALVSMLGYDSKEELMTRSLATDIYQSPQERARLIEQIARSDRPCAGEATWKKKDAKPITVRLSGRAARDDQGTFEGLEWIVENVTAHRQIEEQLYLAQKMEAIGRLTGGVAHDFNNLLNVMIGYSDLLLDHLGAADPRRNYAEEIRAAGQRAAALTRQLLAFSRRQVLQPEVLDLNQIVTEASAMLARLLGETIQLITRLDPSLAIVNVDRGQMEQVILNLAVNARDAMPDGGRLTIETSNAVIGDDYVERRPLMVPGRFVMLAVSDTGEGMDAETQRQIFEPFFTTKEKGKGTGLGLATVYGIVKQSGGFIWVYSEPGQGSTFKVYLPEANETASPHAAPTPARAAVGCSETILLAEDDASLRTLALEFLQSAGYQVIAAGSGAEALRLLGSLPGPLHLLLTDLVLPDMTGTTLSEHGVALRPDMKVLYVSGYTENAIVHRGVLDRDKSFLPKPYAKETLLRRIRELLE
ncbi:MAG: PAS domain S-box protein [Terriglobia bacterium]